MTISTFTQSPLWLAAGWTMLHFCWVGSAIGLVAVTGRWLLRSARPEYRYAFALACFIALAISPVVIAGWLARNLPAATVTEHSVVKNEPIPAGADEVPVGAAESFPSDDLPSPAVIAPPQDSDNKEETHSFAVQTVRCLPWLWITGASLTLLALSTGLIGVERMKRRSQIIDASALQEHCRRLAASLGIARHVAVAVCERLTTPILVGVVRPLILLPPAALAGWSAEEVEMVLLHELIHVRRWDTLVNLLQRTVEALLFFHPVIWWLSAWLRLERELCCDQMVTLQTGRPQAYANLLAALALPTSTFPATALAMSENHLVTRIRYILNLEDQTMRFCPKTLAFALALVIGSAMILGLYAQDTKPASTAKAQSADVNKQNFWIDPVTKNQYFVGAQYPDETKKNSAPAGKKADERIPLKAPAGAFIPALPKGTLPAVVLPFDPNSTTPVAQITTTPGEVEAFEQVSLYSGVAGFIKRLNVDIGDKVKKGDILAELEVPDLEADYQQKLAVVTQAKAEVEVAHRAAQTVRVGVDTAKLQVQEAEAAIKNAQANLAFRKTQYERMMSLLQSKAIEQSVLDEAANKLEAAKTALDAAEAKARAVKSVVDEAQAHFAKAEAGVKVAEAKLAVAQADAQRGAALLQFAKVRAPFDGIVTRRNFFVGDYAPAPGSGKMQPLLVVARTDALRVIIHASENDATRIKVGTPAVIRLDALTGKEFKGKVSRIAGSIDREHRTLRAEIDLPNPDGKILPGMYGAVTLTIEK